MKKVLLLIISLFLITGCSKGEEHKNAQVNNNENIVKEQTIGNLKLSDVSLIYEKGVSTFKVTITNNGEKFTPNSFIVSFKNENDTVITELDGSFGEIEKDTFIALTLTSDIDLSKAYKVEYTIK